jgi:ketosteroid isomerase-like protein
MYRIISVIAFIILCVGCKSPQNDEQAIRTMLEAQVKEWNKGNIDGYMHGYWNNDSLVFIGKSRPTYGYNATLERYKTGYPSTEQMGKLTTTIVSMKKISDDHYFIIGKWALARSIGDVSGSYTLLIKKISGEWVIVVDHSS